MLSSKHLLEKTGISRATLNNYIALGLVPKPTVKPPGLDAKAPRLGYFDESTLELIKRIGELKRQGCSLARISEILGRPAPPQPAATRPDRITIALESGQGKENRIKLSLDEFVHPAYFLNNRFDLEWWNDSAEKQLFGGEIDPLTNISDRELFKLCYRGLDNVAAESREELLEFHLRIAKNRLPRQELMTLDGEVADADMVRLLEIYDKTEPVPMMGIIRTEIGLAPEGGQAQWYNLYATFFREGIFFLYVPFGVDHDDIARFLARRDIVMRELLRHRRPYLTRMAILVADLQSSTRICAELPPNEYFELINEMWTVMEPHVRGFRAVTGKHVGDGLVCFFLPQPDSGYLFSAIECAHAMRAAMVDLSLKWQRRKNWLNRLMLNIAIHCGEEWFGVYQTSTNLEVRVLGDSVNETARLSDFARNGSIWSTKRVISKLTSHERSRIRYGIRRTTDRGEEIIMPNSYARIANLIDLDCPDNPKHRDIANLAVTEIVELIPERDGLSKSGTGSIATGEVAS